MSITRRRIASWEPQPSHCHRFRACRGRKPIRRGRSIWWSLSRPAARPTSSRGCSASFCRIGSASPSSSKTGPAPAPISAPNMSSMPRPMAKRCCSPCRRTPSMRRSSIISITIFSATWRRSRASAVCRWYGRESCVSAEDGSGIHRLCQSQSGQDQHGASRQGHAARCRRRIVQDDGRRRYRRRPVSGRGAGRARSDERPGADHVRRHADVARLHPGRQIARAWR